MKARKLIRGKFDSQYKFIFDERCMKTTSRKQLGYFTSAMDYACRTKGGMRAIAHAIHQPWETWVAMK